jgi:thioredoxin-related protein
LYKKVRFILKYILLSISLFISFVSFETNQSIDSETTNTSSQIDWKTFQDLNSTGNEDRKVMIFIYADWCKWCKELDKSCFSDPVVAEFINSNYFPIKFNGEKDQIIEFKGQTYKLKREDEKVYHQFTEEFNKGDISYPAIVFLDEDMKVIQTIKGFRPKTEMFNVLNYFSGDFYKRISWGNYLKSLEN